MTHESGLCETKPHQCTAGAARKSQSHPDKEDGLSFSGQTNIQVGIEGGVSARLWVNINSNSARKMCEGVQCYLGQIYVLMRRVCE